MSKATSGFIPAILTAVVLQLAASATVAETNRQGVYFGVDIGASVPNDLESTRTNTGIPTNCDQWLPAADLDGDGVDDVPLPLDQCEPRPLPGSPNDFDLDAGLLAGATAGYALHNFRIETEYFYRQQDGESLPLIVPGDEKQQEFVERSEAISDFRGHNFFANLYYDFQSAVSARVIPYLGFGLGLMHTKTDYSATSIRTDDRNRLTGLGRNPNAAGTESRADEALSDNLFGYQLIAGLDYALSERFLLGIKLRYGDSFDNFKDGDNEWTPLRDHGSTVGPPGAPGGDLPVRYEIKADDLNFWGISAGFKYFWN